MIKSINTGLFFVAVTVLQMLGGKKLKSVQC